MKTHEKKKCCMDVTSLFFTGVLLNLIINILSGTF